MVWYLGGANKLSFGDLQRKKTFCRVRLGTIKIVDRTDLDLANIKSQALCGKHSLV